MTDQHHLDILVFGLGAIGSFYGFILSRSKQVRLTVLARSNYEAVQTNGLLIKSDGHGEHTVHPYKVIRSPSEASATKFDYIICANKAIDQNSVASRLQPVIDEDQTTVVIIQNGVGNEDPFRKLYPKLSIISCVTWTNAIQTQPGVVRQQEYEDMQIGLFPNKERSIDESTSRLNAFAALLTEGGAKFQILEDIQVQRWEKVVWNAAWNSLTTLTMLDTRTWLDSSTHATPMTTTLMREVIDVARAAGVALDYGLVDVLMNKILGRPGIGSSMQTDAKEGRPLEAEVILGVPFQKSKALGLQTPTLDIVYTLILAVDCRLRRGASA